MCLLGVFFGFSILLNGSTFAAIHGRWARKLDLAGSSVIPAMPWIALAIFITVMIISFRFKKVWTRWVGTVSAILIGNAIIAYPSIIYSAGAHEIHLSEEPSRELIDQFETHFSVNAVWYHGSDGDILAVRRDDYSPEMESYVKEAAPNIVE